jgi:hypothetical protein
VAELIANTFELWQRKLGFAEKSEPLNSDDFRPPTPTSGQMQLF